MKYSISLDKDTLAKFSYFTGEYIDLVYHDKILLACSDTVDYYAHVIVPILTRDGEDISNIRIPSSLLSDLSVEKFLEIHIFDSHIRCIFSNEKKEFLYSTDLNKQICFVDYKSKLILQRNCDKYSRHNMSSIYPICSTLSKLNSNIVCINKHIYSEHNRCFLFTKADIPNFCLPAKVLSKVLSYTPDCRFIENYMYFNYGEIAIFITKHRVPMSSDLDYILNSKAKEKYTINVKNISQVTRKIKIASNSISYLNLQDGELLVESSENNIRVSTPVISSTVGSAKKTEELDLDSFDFSDTSTGVSITKLPNYKIPSWLIKCIVRTDVSDLIVFKNFIVMKLKLCNIAFPRSLYESEIK